MAGPLLCRRVLHRYATLVALMVMSLVLPAWPTEAKTFLYVGNTTGWTISAYEVDPATGSISQVPGSPFPSIRPGGVTVHPSGRFLYVANYVNAGSVSAYAIDAASGALTPIGSPVAAGTGSYTVNISPSGDYVIAANYGSHNVSVFRVDGATGALTPVGAPTSVGAGPYMAGFSPDGRHVYVPNAESHNVSAFSFDGLTGALVAVPGSPFLVPGVSQDATAPPGTGAGPAYAAVHPAGNFVYVAGVLSWEIVGYQRNVATGALTLMGGFPVPSAPEPFQIKFSPAGTTAYVSSGGTPFARTDGSVMSYTVDTGTGALSDAGVFPSGFATTGVVVAPAGDFLYAANAYANTVSGFAIGGGGLTLLPDSPYPAGEYPSSLAITPSPTVPPVPYSVCPLFDQTKAVRRGATLPVKLQVCDGSGANLSSASLSVHATAIVQTLTSATEEVQDSGNANPDDDFRYDAFTGGSGGYIFNLSTKSIATGTYRLEFTIGTGSTIYSVALQVR